MTLYAILNGCAQQLSDNQLPLDKKKLKIKKQSVKSISKRARDRRLRIKNNYITRSGARQINK